MISAHDLQLFHYVETAEQAWELLQRELGIDADAGAV